MKREKFDLGSIKEIVSAIVFGVGGGRELGEDSFFVLDDDA
jgi:hypothetical protein